MQTFDGAPTTATGFKPAGWDVSVISQEDDTIDGMSADHGPDCGPPDEQWAGGQPDSVHNHFITQAAQAVFQCKDHLMTSMNAGYGAVYLTPPAMLDFRAGPAVVEWDMSTQRTSSRDWVDFMLLPFDPSRSDLQGPMALNMQDFHTPTDGLQVELVGGGNVLMPHTFLSGPNSACTGGSYFKGAVYDCRLPFDGYHTWDMILADNGLAPSAVRRNHFRIEVSKTHLKVGFQPTPGSAYFNWVDTDMPALRFDQAIIQLNQRAYNPLKPCGPGVGDAGHSTVGWQGDCRAATWHWDNVQVSPSTPISIIPSDKRRVNYPGGTVTFAQPAPANAFIKAAGGASDTQYSLDNGATWRTLDVVGPKAPPEVGDSYWTAVPAGTRVVQFRGSSQDWSVQDMYLYSRTATSGTPPAATATPTTVPPTSTATSTPVAGPPTATAVPTVTGAVEQTINFDTLTPADRTLNGQYPTTTIDWATNRWYLSGPFGNFSTNSLGFNGAGPTSAALTFVSPRRLLRLDAYNGGTAATTVTAACSGQPTASVSVPAGQLTTLATGWTANCTTVTLGSTNGWNTNFDNLVINGSGSSTPPTATTVPTRTPTAVPTTPPATTNVNFDNQTNPNRAFSGQYPTNTIDWGTSRWYLSGPFGSFTTNSVGFNGAGPTSATFTLITPRRLISVAAYNGGTASTTITLACAGQPTITRALAAHATATIATNWTQPCTTVTVGSSNGWNSNFDNFIIQ